MRIRRRGWIETRIAALHSAVVVCSTKPMALPAIGIPVASAPRGLRHITNSDRRTFADHYQPRFLGYRLKHHVTVANSQFDAPAFSPAVRTLARGLGALLEGAPDVRTEMMDALRHPLPNALH
jgi:hypothetical protein